MSYFYTHAQGDILGYSSVEWISLSRESDIQEIINHKALTYIILLNEGCFLYFRVSVGDGYVVMAVCPTLFSEEEGWVLILSYVGKVVFFIQMIKLF